jgi:NAD(P)-dependent dehydrogenase (short-subunit alcohol dehydrogenase family)
MIIALHLTALRFAASRCCHNKATNARSPLLDYGAAKGGIISMAVNLARDLAPLGIRSMAIAPGTFLTFAYDEPMGDRKAQETFGPLVLNPKRMGDPDEYAKLAQQVIENDFLNGITIRLDGGQRF